MVCEYDPELMSDEVLFETAAGVARVTINRPERPQRDVFGVMQGFARRISRAHAADDDVRVGCSPAPATRPSARAPISAARCRRRGASAHDGRRNSCRPVRDMWQLGKPVIARVRGYALAAGSAWRARVTLIVAFRRPVFGTPAGHHSDRDRLGRHRPQSGTVIMLRPQNRR